MYRKTRENRNYTCPICGFTDPTKQTIIEIWKEMIILNCSGCRSKVLITIVKQEEKELFKVKNLK
jgi:hypothetical protein